VSVKDNSNPTLLNLHSQPVQPPAIPVPVPPLASNAKLAMLYQAEEESATFVPQEPISRVSLVHRAQIRVLYVQVLLFAAHAMLGMVFREPCALRARLERI